MKLLKNSFDSELMINSIIDVTNLHASPQILSPQNCHRICDVFIYIVSGEAIYSLNDRKYNIKSGDALYISKNTTYHRKILSEQYHTIFVDFNFDVPAGSVLPAEIFEGFESIDNSFKKLYKTWSSQSIGSTASSLCLLYEIYSQMLIKKTRAYISKQSRDAFSDVQNIFFENFRDRDFSIREVEQTSGMSEVHFRRLFKSLHGMSPQQFLLSLRINAAKELLLSSDMSLKEISESSGFSDNCYFSRIFRKKTGFSPSEYRKTFSV